MASAPPSRDGNREIKCGGTHFYKDIKRQLPKQRLPANTDGPLLIPWTRSASSNCHLLRFNQGRMIHVCLRAFDQLRYPANVEGSRSALALDARLLPVMCCHKLSYRPCDGNDQFDIGSPL